VVADGSTQQSVQNFSYLWEFFFPTLFLFASLFPEERGFTRRGAGIPWLRFAPNFETLVYAPHAVHFAVALLLALAPPSFAFRAPESMPALAPLVGLASLMLQVFLAIHRSLFSLVNLGFGIAAIVLLINS
jgi:hypothetical protein